MKKLLKVFSLVLVLAVLCAAVFAISANAAFAGASEFESNAIETADIKSNIALDGIGSTYGDGGDNGQIVKSLYTDKNGNSYVKLNPTKDTSNSNLIIYYDLGNDRIDIPYGTETAYVVFEFDVATDGVGMQFSPYIRHRYGTWADGVYTDQGGATTSKNNWFYNLSGPTKDTRLAESGRWYHITMVGQILEGGVLKNTYYTYIDGALDNSAPLNVNTTKFGAEGNGLRFNQVTMQFGYGSLAYAATDSVLLANLQVKTYMESCDATAALASSISAKNTNAWDASDGIYGETNLPLIASGEVDVTITVDGKTFTGKSFVGASMTEAANAIAKANGIEVPDSIACTPNGDGTYNISTAIAWNVSSPSVTADGPNTASGTAAIPGFVLIDDNNNVVGSGNSGAELVALLENGNSWTVVLGSDIDLPVGKSSSGNGTNQTTWIEKNAVKKICLNGYTLSNTGEVSGAGHMFIVYGKANLTIEGPGVIEKNGYGNVAFSWQGQTSYLKFSNLTIEHKGENSPFVFRGCTNIFENVVVNVYNATGMIEIGDHRASNLDLQIIDSELNLLHNPSHVFTGGNQAAGGTGIVTITGTTINAYDAVFSTAINDSYGHVPMYIDNSEIYSSGHYFAYNKGEVYLGENVILSNVAVREGKFESIYEILAEGYVLAKSNDNNYYVTAKAEDCAIVYWGDAEEAEYWLGNSIPVASANYGAYVVTEVAAGQTYTFNQAPTNAINLYMNLTLDTGFDVNVYVPADAGVAMVYYAGATYQINADTPTAMVGDVLCYVFTAEVAPADAGELLPVAVLFENEEVVTWKVSFAHYAQRILKNPEYFAKEQQIIIDAVNYAAAANAYFVNVPSKANIDEVAGLIAEDAAATTYAAAKVNTDWAGIDLGATGVAEYFDGVTINLTSAPKIRFYLADGVNASVMVFCWESKEVYDDMENGYPFAEEYIEVVNGTVDGKDYIELDLLAYRFGCIIEILVNDGDAYLSWDASQYVDATAGNAEQAVAEALYAYCYSAAKYEAKK